MPNISSIHFIIKERGADSRLLSTIDIQFMKQALDLENTSLLPQEVKRGSIKGF